MVVTMSEIAVMTLENITVDNPSLPRLSADPLVRRGTLLLWDFARPAGYPAQVNPTPNPADQMHANETVVNLANATQMSQLYGEIAGVTYKRGFVMSGTAAVVVQGPNVQAGQGSFVIIAWATLQQIEGQQFFAAIAGQAVGTNGDQAKNSWVIHLGADGVSPTLLLWNPQTTDGDNWGMNLGAQAGLHQVAYVLDAAAHTLTGYLDGAQVMQHAPMPTKFTGLRSTSLGIGMGNWNAAPSQNAFRGTLHRLFFENLSISGRSGADVVQADWEANHGRFG